MLAKLAKFSTSREEPFLSVDFTESRFITSETCCHAVMDIILSTSFSGSTNHILETEQFLALC